MSHSVYPYGTCSSLIEQLRKLQSIVKMSTMKASTTSTCVMVSLLTTLTPSLSPGHRLSHWVSSSSLSCCSTFVLTFSLGLPCRCSCSLSASSFSRQSIHLAEVQRRRNSIHPPPVSSLKAKESLCFARPFFMCYFGKCMSLQCLLGYCSTRVCVSG